MIDKETEEELRKRINTLAPLVHVIFFAKLCDDVIQDNEILEVIKSTYVENVYTEEELQEFVSEYNELCCSHDDQKDLYALVILMHAYKRTIMFDLRDNEQLKKKFEELFDKYFREIFQEYKELWFPLSITPCVCEE